MIEYLDVEAARECDGLRLVLTAGVPGPWGEAAKGLFHVKRIAYAPVRQAGAQPNEALLAWTGHDNAPQAVQGDEPARCGWAEILFLAERLAPQPSLIPADAGERALMFGLSHEICGEDGFGWCRRLIMLHQILGHPKLAASPAGDFARRLGDKYGYDTAADEAAGGRVRAVLGLLSAQLCEQQQRGSPFLVGSALSAVDIYWATFAAMVEPLPEELCPMPPGLRQSYALADPDLRKAADPLLLEHRDRIYRDHLQLPLAF